MMIYEYIKITKRICYIIYNIIYSIDSYVKKVLHNYIEIKVHCKNLKKNVPI